MTTLIEALLILLVGAVIALMVVLAYMIFHLALHFNQAYDMNYFLPALFGLILGHLTKRLINWLGIDDYSIKLNNVFSEITSLNLLSWSFINLNFPEALIFSI